MVLLTEFGWLGDGEGNVVGWDVDRKRSFSIVYDIFKTFEFGIRIINISGKNVHKRIRTT